MENIFNTIIAQIEIEMGKIQSTLTPEQQAEFNRAKQRINNAIEARDFAEIERIKKEYGAERN